MRHTGNIYKTTLSEDIWQLFVDGKMMTLARFPNALTFSDEMWDKYGAQASETIRLRAGQRYYIKALHKQSDQKDNISVAWEIPEQERSVIEGRYLSPAEP